MIDPINPRASLPVRSYLAFGIILPANDALVMKKKVVNTKV